MKNTISRLTVLSLGCLTALTVSLQAQMNDAPTGNAAPAVPIQSTPPSQNPDVPNAVANPAPSNAGSSTTLTAGDTLTITSGEPAKTSGTSEVTLTVVPLSNDDQRFVGKATASGEYEVALSRQATTSATNAQVRNYAASLVKQHEKMSTELLTLATRRGVTLVSEGKHLDDLASLSKKTGNSYDKAYVADMIDAHEDAISLFEKASKSKDTDVAAFAVQYLPALKEHLVQAKQLTKLVD